MNYDQLVALWIASSGDPNAAQNAPTMAAIALAESTGNPDNIGDQYAIDGVYAPSYGLWQIRSVHAAELPNFFPPSSEWSDPSQNASAAYGILHSQGLGAWSTYTNGAYKQFLPGNAPSPVGSGSVPSGIAGTGLQLGVQLTGSLFQQYDSLISHIDPFALGLIVCAALMVFSLTGWANRFASYAAVIIFVLLMIHSSAQNGATPNGTSSAAVPPASQITQPKISYTNTVQQQSGGSSGSSGGSGDTSGLLSIASMLFA